MSGPLDMDTVGDIYVRQSGTFEEVEEVFCLMGGTWKKVWGATAALSAYVPPDTYGAGASSGSIAVATNVVVCTVTGGTAPYTYAWARDDAGAPAWTINSPSSASTSFTVTVPASGFETAEFECVVTDALGATATSGLCYASAENFGTA